MTAATTVRMRNGELSITRRAVCRNQGATRRVYLIDAKDLNEALQVAGGIPAARVGKW